MPSGYVKFVNKEDITSIKGLEYQHIFIIMAFSLYKELENGFEGTGKEIYNQRRLLRIPYSRAKDNIVIFAFGKLV